MVTQAGHGAQRNGHRNKPQFSFSLRQSLTPKSRLTSLHRRSQLRAELFRLGHFSPSLGPPGRTTEERHHAHAHLMSEHLRVGRDRTRAAAAHRPEKGPLGPHAHAPLRDMLRGAQIRDLDFTVERE